MAARTNVKKKAILWKTIAVAFCVSLIVSAIAYSVPPIDSFHHNVITACSLFISCALGAMCMNAKGTVSMRLYASILAMVCAGICTGYIYATFDFFQGLVLSTEEIIVLTVLYTLGLILIVIVCSGAGKTTFAKVYRGEYRVYVIGMVCVALVYAGAVVTRFAAYYFWCASSSSSEINWYLLLFILPVLLVIAGLATLYYSAVVDTNKTFFYNVFLRDEDKPEREYELPATPHGYFLRALLDPATCIPRIKEKIAPQRGTFHINTLYEFDISEIDSWEDEDNKAVMLPVTWQHKEELTNELEFKNINGEYIRRSNDSEAMDFFCDAMRKWSETCQSKVNTAEFEETVAKIAYSIWGNSAPNNGYLDPDRIEESVSDIGMLGYLKELLRQTKYVKPICTKVYVDGNASHIAINTNRDIPLVPVVRVKATLSGRFMSCLSRMLTKHRMRYYYCLANADRCKNYHLTFTGPEGTYFTDSELKSVHGNRDFHVVECMRVNHRYDQQNMRLYIKNGYGFSKCAIMLIFEERSHRSLQALCGASIVTFVLLAYLGLRYVLNSSGVPVETSDIALPLTVLTLASVLSLWEAMEQRRAEEWQWLLSSALFILSASMVLWFAVIAAISSDGKFYTNNVFATVWAIAMGASFFILLASITAIYMQIKQHGALMDRVPYTRCASKAPFAHAETLTEVIGQDSAEKLKKGVHLDDPSIRGQRSINRYGGIDVYDFMIGDVWGDGWLVPVWAALANPYNMGSVNSCKDAFEHYHIAL